MRVEIFVTRFRELTLQPIQDELIQVKRELADEQCTLTDSEVLAEVAKWMTNVGHTWGRYNQYMYTVDIHRQLKFLLGRVLLEKNATKEDMLLSLDHM